LVFKKVKTASDGILLRGILWKQWKAILL